MAETDGPLTNLIQWMERMRDLPLLLQAAASPEEITGQQSVWHWETRRALKISNTAEPLRIMGSFNLPF